MLINFNTLRSNQIILYGHNKSWASQYVLGSNMEDKNKIVLTELKRLSVECRIQSKGTRPHLSLMRIASSLESLLSSLDDSTITPTNPLTAREREVLFHVSQGFTNREIASAFSISEKTIEFHLKSIFAKTESSTRTESVKNALKNKWID